MKSRSLFSPLTIVIFTVFLLIIIGFFIFAQKDSLLLKSGGVKTNPQATKFVSKQAPVMVSLLINPEELREFSRLVSDKKERSQVKRDINQIIDNILTKTQLDYKKDIQEWLGDEATLAVTSLDFDHDSSNGVQPGYLLAVKNKDSQLAKDFLQIYYSENIISDNVELIFDSYKGVNLIYQKPLNINTNIPKIASAVVGDFILFANDIQVLKEAINDAQAVNLNLTNYPAYENALKTIDKTKISVTYLNLPRFSAWISNKAKTENELIEQTLTSSVTINTQGFKINNALFGVKGEEKNNPIQSSPPATLNYVSSDSILVAAGINLDGFWQQIITGLPENSPLQQIINQAIIPIEKSLHINLAEDIFSQVKGEYALSLLTNSQSKKLDWLFVTENEDISLIENLDILAEKQDLTVGNLPLFDNNITAWTQLETKGENESYSVKTEVKGVHTNIDNYQILTNSVDLLSDTIKQKNSLLNNDQFQEIIKLLPAENDGYLYINWREFEPVIAQRFPIIRLGELAFKPLFDRMRSLILTSEGTENDVSKATIFVTF